MRALPWVALAGALGAVCRFLVDAVVVRRAGPPWGTAMVNVLGSFGAGLVAGLLSRGRAPDLQLVLATGFLGAFTTFSTWMVQTVGLLEAGRHLRAATSLGSVLAGVLAALGGLLLAT
jgi:CrcB protein